MIWQPPLNLSSGRHLLYGGRHLIDLAAATFLQIIVLKMSKNGHFSNIDKVIWTLPSIVKKEIIKKRKLDVHNYNICL